MLHFPLTTFIAIGLDPLNNFMAEVSDIHVVWNPTQEVPLNSTNPLTSDPRYLIVSHWQNLTLWLLAA